MKQRQSKNMGIPAVKEQGGAESWVASNFATGVLPPFSFTYGGKSSSEFLSHWQFSQETKRVDGTKTTYLFTYADPQTDLVVLCTCEVFSDFPTVEWVVTFKNNGADNTPIIEDIQALDTMLARKEDGEFVLHRTLGSQCSKDDFAPIDEVMSPNAQVSFAPVGGRSSNISGFPFFNIETPGEGVMVGIGWSGQWAASLIRDSSIGLRVRAGMEKTHLMLYPGEQIRIPKILLLFWEGNRMHGHNLLRRFIYQHHTPKVGQECMLPLVSCNTWFPSGDDGNKANEQNQIELIEAYSKLGIEYVVIDAGWFDGLWSGGVGNWTVRQDAYPNGLKPVADVAHRHGIKFGLWFEPERVAAGTRLDKEHPEWLIRLPSGSNYLLNLGIPEARNWVVDMVSNMIETIGIDYFRHDCNIDPLKYWRAADAPNRQGITEIRYIEQLYELWDELLRRHPSLMIEGCASGGRRIDLESISRCHIYWKSDFYFNSVANQGHAYGGNLFLPTNYFNTPLRAFDDYDFRSCLGGSLCLGWDPRAKDFPIDKARGFIQQYKALRPLMLGDFYPLLNYSVQEDQSIGFQFHRQDIEQGMVILFRRSRSPFVTVPVKFNGVKPDTLYQVCFEDSGEKQVVQGRDLIAGLNITLLSAPSSALVTYRAE